jgi:hypothetical protein
MNNRIDQETLLTEIFAGASPADFRAAMLAETLRLVRRRRHFRQFRRGLGVFVVMGLLVVFVAQQFSKLPVISRPQAKKFAMPNYELVLTQPLPASALIATHSFSMPGPSESVPKVVEIVTAGGGFRLINDNELLTLLADKPAALIRTGPHSEELVFANPEDQKKLLVY